MMELTDHSRTQSPSYARCDEGLWPNPYSELASDWLVLTPDIVFLPCFCGIRLWIWPEPLVAPRVRRALGTRMLTDVSTLVLILCAPQSLFAYARSKWPTRKSYIIEPSTSKANPSIAGRQNRQNQPGIRKEHFAKRYATKMYLNDATGR